MALLQAPEIDAATLHMLPDDGREALLQRLLEQKLRSFAMQVRLFYKHLVNFLCPLWRLHTWFQERLSCQVLPYPLLWRTHPVL